MNSKGGLVGGQGGCSQAQDWEGWYPVSVWPCWGRGTHFAGVSVAILRARTNHIITAVTAVIRLMEKVGTPGFVYDGDLHFLKIVGRWQICQGWERERQQP